MTWGIRALLLAMAVLLAGCLGKTHTAIQAGSLVGCYERVDDIGYNVLELVLRDDLTYTARLRGDVGDWGNASGNWSVADNLVVLTPREEADKMVGFLRELSVRQKGDQYTLQSPRWDPLQKVSCPAP